MTPQEELALINSTFADTTDRQKNQFAALWDLYTDWNSKINVISRKDIEHLYLHHILHSLGVLKVLKFLPETRVIDVGTGGGFPGIPLAIMLPQVQFTLVDSIGKKVKVAENVAQSIGLDNVKTIHARVEDLKEQCHFIVTRATMPLVDLVKLSKHLLSRDQFNALPNGFIALKGGNLASELSSFGKKAMEEDLYPFLPDPYFKEKKVVYLPS